VFEHTINFPFGEIWIDEGSNTSLLGFKFSAKELDEETGYIYFGARFYDPKIGGWLSTDAALPEYIPNGKDVYFPEKKFNAKNLKGSGGFYKSININLYQYGFMNPINYIDPDGNTVTDPDTGITYYNDFLMYMHKAGLATAPDKYGEQRITGNYVIAFSALVGLALAGGTGSLTAAFESVGSSLEAIGTKLAELGYSEKAINMSLKLIDIYRKTIDKSGNLLMKAIGKVTENSGKIVGTLTFLYYKGRHMIGELFSDPQKGKEALDFFEGGLSPDPPNSPAGAFGLGVMKLYEGVKDLFQD